MKNKLSLLHKIPWLRIAFLQSLVALIGSLIFSDFMGLAPCKLCWYQRIAMYPLAWIIGVGIFFKDRKVIYYALPLTIFGLITAAYHSVIYYDNFLNYGIIGESLITCDAGASCTSQQITWLGFISIPLMSFIAFAIIGFSLWYHHNYQTEPASK